MPVLVTSIFKALHSTVPEFLRVPVTVVKALRLFVLYVQPLITCMVPLISAVVVFNPRVILTDLVGTPNVKVEPALTIKSGLSGPLLVFIVRTFIGKAVKFFNVTFVLFKTCN